MGFHHPENYRAHSVPHPSIERSESTRLVQQQLMERDAIRDLLHKGGDVLMSIAAFVGVVGFFTFVCLYALGEEGLRRLFGSSEK